VKESIHNIQYTCPEHSPKPNAALIEGKVPEDFIGTYVKKSFKSDAEEGPRAEHMWVKIKRIHNGTLVGTLENDPIHVIGLEYGDLVAVKLEEIEAVLED
jgi:uncharacterized protein YegJ (DUF2314 family)